MPEPFSLIRHNLLDKSYYDDLRAQSTLLQGLENDILRAAPGCAGLLADFYFLLYKKALVFETPPTPGLRSLVLAEAAQQSGLQKLRSRTAGNRAETHIALWLLTQDLLERLRGAPWLREAAELLEALGDAGAVPTETGPGLTPEPPRREQDFWKGVLSPRGLAALERLARQLQGDSGLAEQAETLETLADAAENPETGEGRPPGLPDPDRMKAAIQQAQGEEDPLNGFLESLSPDDSSPGETRPEAGGPAEEPAGAAGTPGDAVPGKNGAGSGDSLADSLRKAAAEGRRRLAAMSAGTWRGQNAPMTLPGLPGQDERRMLASGAPLTGSTPAAEVLSPGADSPGTEDRRALKGLPAPGAGTRAPEGSSMPLLVQLRRPLSRLKAESLFDRAVKGLDDFEALLDHGGTSPRELDPLPYDEALRLYKRALDPVMVRFFNKVGQKREIARRAQHRKKARRDLPVDRITPDDDLDSILDEELTDLALGIEAFENSFIDRFLHQSLLTRAKVSRRARHKGPIVLCYDGSGSMEGDKILETKAHILAFLEVARQQKRRMVTIQFASASEPLFVRELHPHRIRLAEVLELMDTFLKGGTDFERPLKEALRYLESDRFRNGDILFITDGICDISEGFKRRFLASKAEKRFRLYAVIIHGNTYGDYGDLSDISDEILEIRQRDLSDWNHRVSERIFSI